MRALLLLAGILTFGACHWLLPFEGSASRDALPFEDTKPGDTFRPGDAFDIGRTDGASCRTIDSVSGNGWQQNQTGWWWFGDVDAHYGVGLIGTGALPRYSLEADVVIASDQFKNNVSGGAGFAVNASMAGVELVEADFCDLSVTEQKLIPGYCPSTSCTAKCCGVWADAKSITAKYKVAYRLRAEVDTPAQLLTCRLELPDKTVVALPSQPFHSSSGGLALLTQYAQAEFRNVTLCPLP